MKVLIGTDIEGVAGVVSFEPQAYPEGKDYAEAMTLLTAEVNAAVEGLLEAGAQPEFGHQGTGANSKGDQAGCQMSTTAAVATAGVGRTICAGKTLFPQRVGRCCGSRAGS